jgi:hypothetical protein
MHHLIAARKLLLIKPKEHDKEGYHLGIGETFLDDVSLDQEMTAFSD